MLAQVKNAFFHGITIEENLPYIVCPSDTRHPPPRGLSLEQWGCQGSSHLVTWTEFYGETPFRRYSVRN